MKNADFAAAQITQGHHHRAKVLGRQCAVGIAIQMRGTRKGQMLPYPRNKQAIGARCDAPYAVAVDQALIPETYLLFLQGLGPQNTLRLSDYLLQIFSIHLDCGMLVNQFDCQHEPHAVALSYESP